MYHSVTALICDLAHKYITYTHTHTYINIFCVKILSVSNTNLSKMDKDM